MYVNARKFTIMRGAGIFLSAWLSMVGAMQAVKNGNMGCNRAATEYGVPKTTFKDRLSGRVIHGTKSGRQQYLTSRKARTL